MTRLRPGQTAGHTDPLAGYDLWPGSRKAQDAGCTCPVLDNGHGNVGLARDRGGWWQFSDCPVHGPEPAPIPERT